MKSILVLMVLCSLYSSGFSAIQCASDRVVTLPLTRIGEKFYYIETNTRANWFSATNFCNLHNMRLISIASAEEHEDLRHYLKTEKIHPVGIWTSGNDLGQQGSWYWSSYGKKVIYTNWAANEPNNYLGKERCIELRGREDLEWNDIACDHLRDFICELGPS